MRPTKVCVSGVTGFVGAQIVADLLAQGYKVHGTVRKNTPERVAHLTGLPQASNLSIFEADLLTPGSFTAALEGCEAAMHVASPYTMNVHDAQKDLVDPAVKGTLSFLESCAEVGSVRKVIVTSSVAAIADEGVKGKVFTEDDWNTKSTLKRLPYYFSKAKAEKAAWDWAENHKNIKVVVINPFVVIGPSLVKSLNESAKIIQDIALGNFPGVLRLVFTFVDVRDVSAAHIAAMENDSANGRYICASQPPMTMKEIVKILHDEGFHPKTMDMTGRVFSSLVKTMSHVFPGHTEGQFLRNNIDASILVSNAKIKQELGIRFREPDATVKDTLADLIKWGHLSK